ncbi:hypothetical protein PH505_be00390 [Pseudoalteromonas distincta]|nr:hypothetical protein PH505_be00390 [Pseudoalteromonas distincta]
MSCIGDIQSTLAYIFKKFKAREKIAPSRSQVDEWKKGLMQASHIMKGCEWATLSDDKEYASFIVKLARYYRDNSFSKSTLNNLIKSLNRLNQYDLCARVISSKDFKDSIVLKKTQQHIAIPIGIYQPLIANAISVIETYHPYRTEINQVMLKARDIWHIEKNSVTQSREPSAVSQRIKNQCTKIHSIPNFKINISGTELSRILTNCAIVLLAFSGARVSEMRSFSKKSYREKYDGKEKSIPILEGETTKGNDGIPKIVTWQTHPIVRDALELAYDMTQHLREAYKTRIKGQFENGELTSENYKHALKEINGAFIAIDEFRVTSIYTLTSIDEKLNAFIRKSGIIASQVDVDEFNRLNPSRQGQLKVGGKLPKLSPHDFRRTFAVFFKRYGFGTASSIKFQYKHQNIMMSEYYANNASLQAMEDVLLDNELLALMNEEGIRMGVDVFDEIYNESEQLSGAGGERIAQDKYQKLKQGHQVFMSRNQIEVLVRNGTLSVVKLPTGGYCLNATCSRVCGIGQFSAEIKPCEHQVITDKEAKNIFRQNKRLIKSFREMNIGDSMMQSILVGMKQKIKRNEVTIKKHNLNYEEFNDVVKGIIPTERV